MIFNTRQMTEPSLSQRSSRRRNRAVAGGASALFHLVLLAALLGEASGSMTLPAAEGKGADEMNVTLVSAAAFAARREPAPSQDLKPLIAKYSNDEPPIFLPPPADKQSNRPSLRRLFQRLTESQPTSARKPLVTDTSYQATGSDTLQADGQLLGAASSPTESRASTAGAPGSLWGAIEPCWQRLAINDSEAVVLDLELDQRGQISVPPKIIRQGAVTERQLLAEARALSALRSCLPSSGTQFGGRKYRLNFGNGR